MRVFVTGATGFLGFAIVKELIAGGHEVTGLARSEASAKKLTGVGAEVLRGDIEQLEVLRQGAAAADGAIHTAFYHQVSHLPLATRLRVFLGGLPTGIFDRFFNAALGADRRALETLGGALRAGSPLVGTFGMLSMKPGVLATEDQSFDPTSPGLEFLSNFLFEGGHAELGLLRTRESKKEGEAFRNGEYLAASRPRMHRENTTQI